jgi:hypothetical protein
MLATAQILAGSTSSVWFFQQLVTQQEISPGSSHISLTED